MVNLPMHAGSEKSLSPALLLVRFVCSIALLPLLAWQGRTIQRTMPRLKPARPPHEGIIPGEGPLLRVIAVGESSASGVGLATGEETVAAVAARRLAQRTKRAVAWQARGLYGATVREGFKRLLPSLVGPADLLIVAFGVNDAKTCRSPHCFARDLAQFVNAARERVGDAAVVIAGVAPLNSFPALRWPLATVLGWRAEVLQLAAERLLRQVPRLVVQRMPARIEADFFAADGFHTNAKAHARWGEDIAALALSLLEGGHRTFTPALTNESQLTLRELGSSCCGTVAI